MVQINLPACPQCGTPVSPGQRFCSNCGATTDAGYSAPTSMASSSDPYPQNPEAAAPPPPPESLYTQPVQQFSYYPAPPQPAPSYARPQKDSTKSVLGQIGCGMLLLILLIVGVCGGVSYLGYNWIKSLGSSASTHTTAYSSTTTGGSGSGTTTTAAATSLNINQQVTYASDKITIKSVQEGAGTSSTFADDASATNAPVVVRLNIHEVNPTTSTIYLNYSNSAHLVVPGNSTAQYITAQQNSILNQGVSQDNWLDYQLSSNVAIDQLTLQLGTTDEAQMTIPLTGKADLSAYTLKTIKPNTTFQYAGMNWTLTTVTSNWSAGGQQAKSGQRYVVVTLNLSNPTANYYYFSASSVTRLQGGSVTNAPKDSSGPSAVAGGATNQSETVTFLAPQNVSSLNLIMLAQPDATPAVSEYRTTFQI